MKRNASAILLVLALLIALVALNFIFFVDTRAAEETEASADRSSHRSTPYGTLAFYTLLEESGYPVARYEKPFTELRQNDPAALVVIGLPEANNPSEEEFTDLQKWVEEGGLLVIIDRDVHINFGEIFINTERVYSSPNMRPLQQTPYTRGVREVAFSGFATRVKISDHAATYHIGDVLGAALADVKVGNGRVVLMTDPFVVANNGIREGDNVMLALNLLVDRPQGTIAFDEYHHGYTTAASGAGIMAYFRGTPVPWMMWQGALIVALVIYTFGRRFACPLPLRRERRTTNLEFVSSMANITRLARASDLAMQNIYFEFRKRLCRSTNLPVTVNIEKLAAASARRAGTGEREMLLLLTRCEEVARGGPVSDAELLRLVSRMREIESSLGF